MTVREHTILIVDDRPENLQVLSQMLTESGYGVRAVTSGKMALMTVERALPDLILLDVMMPEMDGYKVCQTLKASPDTSGIPVIFISALDAPVDKVKAFEMGAVDYITKPFHLEEVQARIATHLQIKEQQQEIERLREEDRRYFDEVNYIREDLVRSITHELKSPLAVIFSYASTMQRFDAIKNNERLAHCVSAIKRSTMSMSELIGNILEAAKIEAGIDFIPTSISITDLIKIHVNNFESLAENKSITMTFHQTDVNAVVEADERLMGMAISNLLSNAIKYTPEGGSVDIYVRATGEDRITISVNDTGVGIPEDDLPNIFKRFYRVAHESHLAIEGNGLGLSIVDAIIQQHKGKIEVVSKLDEGTGFNITLPIAS